MSYGRCELFSHNSLVSLVSNLSCYANIHKTRNNAV